MRRIKILANMLMVAVTIIGFSSCKEEESIDIIAVTSCSPDLLEFVTPTVEIIGNNQEAQIFTLTKSDFKESEVGGTININVTVNGETHTASSTTVNYIAECIKRFKTESVSGQIKVSYSLNENYNLNKERYVFFHGIGYDSKSINEEGISVWITNSYYKPIAYEVAKEDVEAYLEKLISSYDETPFEAQVAESL